METVAPAQSANLRRCRGIAMAAMLAILSVFVFAQPAVAQNGANQACQTPLCLSNNYFVTGDYVVGGVGLRGMGVNGLATGTISIPDTVQAQATGVPSKGVPAGADIVAAFLYWQTVESSQTTFVGQNGFFGPILTNGQAFRYPIQGTVLGNPNAPVSWSSGGCSGSSQGSKTIRTYRADVRPFLSLDANGKPMANGSFQVSLADSGSNGGGVPLTLGATLVIIYRVESPNEPLSSVVLYDGSFAPSNTSSSMMQTIMGFYDADASPIAEITHIVGNGQSNKAESVSLNTTGLPSLYSGLPPFPGVYNGSWDNPTWSGASTNTAVNADDPSATTSVIPGSSNSGCVSWGAIIFKTTVANPDGDGLLKLWKKNQGYTDALSGQPVSLPGAALGEKDLFVELDYLSNLDGSAGAYLHSHLPKQQALDMVGNAFAARGIHIHFDVGNVYQSPRLGGPSVPCGTGTCDPYIISDPPGTGGNAISEGSLLCTDSATLCQYPGQVSVGWKGGLLSVQSNATQGNFQSGRKDSYHYVLFGHALGSPRTYWPAAGAAPSLQGSGLAVLNSIVVSNNVGIVTLSSFPPLLKPGDCPAAGVPACKDPSLDRVTIQGALQPGDATLNGTYKFLTAPSSSVNSTTNLFTTIFTIQTSGVPNGTYNFSNEPQLGLAYGGPTSASGYSDVGGGDSSVMFGLWPADDALGCQPDPSAPAQVYCVNQVGTIQAEAGTLLHEMGHTFGLTHGGAFYPGGGVATSGALAGQQQDNSPFVAPNYALNCNPAFLSSMNYLYQIRGFPEFLPDGTHPIDYSGQTLPNLDENGLNETIGLGLDIYTGAAGAHFTRWYAPPNALDLKLQSTVGGRFATLHCDGTPIGPSEPPAVRVDGSTFSSPIDWNNDFIVPDADAWQDVDFNGSTSSSADAPFPGFNDWVNLDLRQIGARSSTFDVSSGSGSLLGAGGGSLLGAGGGSLLGAGGGSLLGAGGGSLLGAGGGSLLGAGGGAEQDADIANSTADSPIGLSAVNSNKTVVLTWTAPGFGQIREYDVWRAVGSFTTSGSLVANQASFQIVGKVTGAPPTLTFTDSTVKNNVTYTYFLTDKNKQGVQSGASAPATIFVKF
jgi:hypothetical protein